MSDDVNPFSWLWNQIKSFFWTAFIVPLFPLLGLLPAFMVLIGLLLTTGTQIDTIIATINGLSSQIRGTPATIALSQANRVIPLSEGMVMIGSLLGLRAAALFVRFVLSWIPGR